MAIGRTEVDTRRPRKLSTGIRGHSCGAGKLMPHTPVDLSLTAPLACHVGVLIPDRVLRGFELTPTTCLPVGGPQNHLHATPRFLMPQRETADMTSGMIRHL